MASFRDIRDLEAWYNDREEAEASSRQAERDFAEITSFTVPPLFQPPSPLDAGESASRGGRVPEPGTAARLPLAPWSGDRTGGSVRGFSPEPNLDRRTHAGSQYAKHVSGNDAWIEVGQQGRRFRRPGGIPICVRRLVRKQVLFALGHGGHGFKTRKRRNEWSNVSCR